MKLLKISNNDLEQAFENPEFREKSISRRILGKEPNMQKKFTDMALLAGVAGGAGVIWRGAKRLRKRAEDAYATYENDNEDLRERKIGMGSVAQQPRQFFSPNSVNSGSIMEIKDPNLRLAHGGTLPSPASRLKKKALLLPSPS